MRAAITAHDIGTVFRLARELAGISYSKIAAECDIKPERVGTLARGKGSVTSFEKIARVADALRIPGRMLGLAPRIWEKSEPVPARDRTSEEDDNPVERRRFLRAGTGAGLAAALPEMSRPAGGRRLGSEVPGQLRLRTARLRRLDQVLGGGDTYRVYLGEYQATKALLRDSTYTEQTRLGLLSALAEQAQQAGWAAFDAGRATDARGLYEESHSAATEAGDTDLAGNALAFLAYQAVSGDQKAGVEIAARSCATIGPDAPAGVRALLHERLAWACAVAGRVTECEHALAAAETALATAGDTPQPDWVSWVDTTELQIMTGRCWTELHRPLRAVPVLETALAAYDDTNARDKALYLSWLGDSYLTAGEVEQAATTADRALDLAHGVASVRPRARLAPLLQRLDAHRGLPVVDALLEKAAAV
ncbi:helix-turn-helix domain-containing protein [Streptomyces sp. NPDC021224]|uniref:helix-turn-helix domain-containing protein n=1 Tax=unclassified Streptomyces TaxID=2593676 RepID=UPI003791C65A